MTGVASLLVLAYNADVFLNKLCQQLTQRQVSPQ